MESCFGITRGLLSLRTCARPLGRRGARQREPQLRRRIWSIPEPLLSFWHACRGPHGQLRHYQPLAFPRPDGLRCPCPATLLRLPPFSQAISDSFPRLRWGRRRLGGPRSSLSAINLLDSRVILTLFIVCGSSLMGRARILQCSLQVVVLLTARDVQKEL